MSLNLNRRLVDQQDAALVQRPDVPRSVFTGSWTRKTTFNAADLVPILVDEVLPGDHLKYDITAYLRLSTPLFPLFDNMRVDTFFYFIPMRLVWEDSQKFFGELPAGQTALTYTIPKITLAEAGAWNAAGTLADHLGLPIKNLTAGQSIEVNALPFRCYSLVYNEWFRDQNLVTAVTWSNASGPDATTNTSTLYKRAKAHDYFTSALPWPQKFTAPSVSVGGYAPVKGIGLIDNTNVLTTNQSVRETAEYGTVPNPWPTDTYNPRHGTQAIGLQVKMAFNGSNYAPQVFADLSSATGMSINDFRQAMLIQQLLERDARGGTRYTEIVKNHFGVTSPDARLQRPEFIGGGSTPLQLTPIAQTTTGGGGLGALGAAGTAVGSHRASVAATEHGYVLGLINVRSELSYSQGLHKMWSRTTRHDLYWPSLAGLGEQAILRQEIYCTGVDVDDGTVFGYQERWHEYRARTSEVVGMFRPKVASNIDEWHLSQEFSAAPTLGQTFIEDAPPMTRVLAAGGTANNMQFLGDILYRRQATRPLPMYGTPVTLGRF